MRTWIVTLAMLTLGPFSLGQTSTGAQTTNGNCSPIINGNGNSVCSSTPAQRKLPDDLKAYSDYLSAMPMKALIIFQSGDNEAVSYASQLAKLLRGANWSVEGPSGAMMMAATPLYGVEIRWRGAKATGNSVPVDDKTAWGRLILVLQKLQQDGIQANPEPEWDADRILIMVEANPATKPQ
jgi:hypothetical protein